MAIKTRQTDGTGVTNNNAPLTNAELDNNFIELVAEDATKADLSGADFTGNVTVDTDTLYVDATNDRVGININSPDYPLHVISPTNYQTVKLGYTNTANEVQRVGIASRNYANDADVGMISIFDNGSTAVGLSIGGAGSTAPGIIQFYNNNGTSNLERMRILEDGSCRWTIDGSNTNMALSSNGSFTINENGSADSDFRVESDDNANMIFVDAATDRVGVGKNNPGTALDVLGGFRFSQQITSANVYPGTGTTNFFRIFERHFFNANDFTTAGGLVEVHGGGRTDGLIDYAKFYLNTKQQQGSDLWEIIPVDSRTMQVWYKWDASGGDYSAGLLEVFIKPSQPYQNLAVFPFMNATNGNDSILVGNFVMEDTGSTSAPAGAVEIAFPMKYDHVYRQSGPNNGPVVFNENGADMDFRVESDDNAYMIWVDASNDFVRIGGNSTLPNNTKQFIVGGIGCDPNTYSTGTHEKMAVFLPATTGLGNKSALLIGGGAYGTAGNETLKLQFANTHGQTGRPVGWDIDSYTDLDVNAYAQALIFNSTRRNSSGEPLLAEFFRMNVAPDVSYSSTFNESGINIDFRVESDANAHAIFVDASAQSGNGRVGILESAPDVALHVGADGIGGAGGIAISSNISGTYRSNTMYMDSYNNQGRFFQTGPDTTTRGSGYLFHSNESDGGGTLEICKIATPETVFNDSAADQDFRVESANQPHMLFVDANEQSVRINSASNPDIVGTDRTFNFFANDTFALGNFSGGATSYAGGAYIASSDGFGAEGSSTTITWSDSGAFSTDNTAGFIMVYAVSDASPGSAGTLLISFAKVAGSANAVQTVHTHKQGITTLTASASGNDILITHDSDVAISWIVLGAG